MSKVFPECTCCFKSLDEDDLKLNSEKESYYSPICRGCVDKFTNKIVKIIEKK